MHQGRTSLRGRPLRLLAWLAAAVMLGACAAQVPSGVSSGYAAARGALEGGDYPTAIRLYEDLLSEAGNGRVGASLRLEYAHALLRADEPDRALAVAREVVAMNPEPAIAGRASLLAAIAEHEIAERLIAGDASYQAAQEAARAAYASLGEVLDLYPQFDPDGVIVRRMNMLRERLATLELDQLRADLDTGRLGIASDRADFIVREFGDTTAAAQWDDLLRRARRRAGASDGTLNGASDGAALN